MADDEARALLEKQHSCYARERWSMIVVSNSSHSCSTCHYICLAVGQKCMA